MRITIIIAALIYWCAPAVSMTIELERRFGSELAIEEFTILSSTDIELFAPVIEEFVAKKTEYRDPLCSGIQPRYIFCNRHRTGSV